MDKEENEKKRIKYHKYKRGQFVIVRFGEGTGNEFSGTHPAIVLNKNDSPFNGTLTVVPLSSKKHKQYLELGQILDDSVYNLLRSAMQIHIISRHEIQEIILKHHASKTIDIKTLTDEIQEKLLEIDPPELKEDCAKFFELYKKYNHMLKESYAVITNITTISKFKILKPINDVDPLKSLIVKTSILNKIDNAIISLYTH